ncbi:MAG: sigma-70 family RNA polymerase sigma factor, partial [Candidatus Omnitrophica bacterium]|nr:sigma-70 family RNA polymerase sigma factor [Candidatus Omnitrophota bacterium]
MDSKNQGQKNQADSELLAHLLSDPEKGWESFWGEYQPFIHRVIGRFHLGDQEPDVIQEIAQILIQNDYKRLRDWDPERSSLRRYLTIISVSCTINYVKSSKYRFDLLKIDTIDTSSGMGESFVQFVDEAVLSPAERLERVQIVELLRDSLEEWVESEKVQPLDRDIIEFRLRGLTFKEISEILDVTLSHVTTRF